MRRDAIDVIVAGSARSIGTPTLDVDRLHVECFATTHGRLHSEANGDIENKTSTCQTCPCSGVDCP